MANDADHSVVIEKSAKVGMSMDKLEVGLVG